MKERAKFVLAWEALVKRYGDNANFSALCREFGISRQCGYKWRERFESADGELSSLEDSSRRPHTMPTKTSEAIETLVVEFRKAHPAWGPRKIAKILRTRHPDKAIPGASAVGAILSRRGLTLPRKRRKRYAVPLSTPFSHCQRANDVWCVDFKGWFRLGNQRKCHPLTITDGYSRFIIRCEALYDPITSEVMAVFDSAFQEFGLPRAIRSDNGPPFASTGAGGLTALSVWWTQLGIALERIEPGKPQQNGRHERMHLTLKNEVCSHPSTNLKTQQKAFDVWRKEFNEIRPHEALGLRPPIDAYKPSPRKYPRPLREPDYMTNGFDEFAVYVDKQGRIPVGRHKIFVSTALWGLPVFVQPEASNRWALYYANIRLGSIHPQKLERGLSKPRRRKR